MTRHSSPSESGGTLSPRPSWTEDKDDIPTMNGVRVSFQDYASYSYNYNSTNHDKARAEIDWTFLLSFFPPSFFLRRRAFDRSLWKPPNPAPDRQTDTHTHTRDHRQIWLFLDSGHEHDDQYLRAFSPQWLLTLWHQNLRPSPLRAAEKSFVAPSLPLKIFSGSCLKHIFLIRPSLSALLSTTPQP